MSGATNVYDPPQAEVLGRESQPPHEADPDEKAAPRGHAHIPRDGPELEVVLTP